MSGSDERFSIGPDAEWCGLAKLIEEAGEVLQTAGKLVATGGSVEHWDGEGPLDTRLADEVADLIAAAEFFAAVNFDMGQTEARVQAKERRFRAWRRGETAVVPAPSVARSSSGGGR